MDALLQIEQKYGFALPSAYRTFFDRVYVTYPSGTYLWVDEAEWLPIGDILNRGGFGIVGSPKAGLVAFAFSGRRDLWAWQTQRVSEVGEPTIVFCPRDSYQGKWYAPSFLGWLYRISLEYASSMWEEEAEIRLNLNRLASVLHGFGKSEWADFLQSIASREVVVSRSGPRGQQVENPLISEQEVSSRIVEAFGPGFINSPYIWDLEGEQATG